MYKRILVLTALAMVFSGIGSPQPLTIEKQTLVGTWKLVSASNVTDKGIVNREAYGPNPIGFLTYTADGRMMGILTNGGRKPLSKGWKVAPAEEKAEAFSTSLSYAGTFTVSGDRVTHHVEATTDPNRLNKDLVRMVVRLEGDRVTLRTAEPLAWDDGVRYAYQELVWDRIR
ncbi:MAG: lipocalin-like domain-containing protein [Bryobacteraceae bacterium]